MQPHPFQNLYWYPLISSTNIWPKISVAYLTKWFQSNFSADWWRMYPFNLSLLLPAYIPTQSCKKGLILKPEPGPSPKSQAQTWLMSDIYFWSPIYARKPNLSRELRYAHRGARTSPEQRAVKKLRAMETYEKQKNCYQLCLLLFNNHVGLKNNNRIYRTCISIWFWKTIKLPVVLLWKRHLCPHCPSFERSGRQCHRSLASLLAVISSHCLAALPAKMSALNSHLRQTA